MASGASEGSTTAIIKLRDEELALMPPPLIKRIKRPTEVLDEDTYTEALSDIIARDYYPGLRETKAQEEYLQALESKNPQWIRQAERELRAARDGESAVKKVRRETRDGRFDTPRSYKQAGDTPKGLSGSETPLSTNGTEFGLEEEDQNLDTSTLSLSSYQAKYTSEDNSSFNTILDKQNEKRRQKHAHLWTQDQRIPSQRLIAHRAQTQQLIQDKEDYESTNGKALIPMTTGATDSRSSKPSSWKISNPANNFMFSPSTSVDEQGLTTIAELKESMSKAGPKQIIQENTRFPPSGPGWDNEDADDTTSIHTSFIARRNAAGTDVGTVTGAETPRVNGYSFVDDEEPLPSAQEYPTYRDLLAGQTGDSTPNPFKLKENRAREDLHHKLVDKDAEKHRARQKEIMPGKGGKDIGNMTPAARKMMERLGGRTPVTSNKSESRREDWTPASTPRRARTAVK